MNLLKEQIIQEDLNQIFQDTKDLFAMMRGKRFFISGGTGFFGFWLLESFCNANRLLGLNSEATVLTRNPERFATKWPHLAKDPAIRLSKETFEIPHSRKGYTSSVFMRQPL